MLQKDIMTFIRWKIINGNKYAYRVTGVRYGDKVRSYCKYLGKEGSFDEESLKILLRKETEQKRKKRVLQRKLLKEKEEENNREFLRKIVENRQKDGKNDLENLKEIEKILGKNWKLFQNFRHNKSYILFKNFYLF